MNPTLSIASSPEHLLLHGPVINVSIRDANNANSKSENVVALIDTGADINCVSPGLVKRLGLVSIGENWVRGAGNDASREPVTHLILEFEIGTIITGEFRQYRGLNPDLDIVIGRDILRNTILFMDFTTGRWSIQFVPPSSSALLPS